MSMMRELRKITDQVNDIHANTLVAQQIALELSDIRGSGSRFSKSGAKDLRQIVAYYLP